MRILIIVGIIIGGVIAECQHLIFCNPQALQAAADSKLFSDSKTFVDLVLKVPIQEALTNLKTLSPVNFIQNTFYIDPEILLSPVKFPDFTQNPEILSRIEDLDLKNFASELNKIWNQLGKKLQLGKASNIGTCKQNCSSYLSVADNFTILVPGGRFRESYYWDSYWIILGLLACDMYDTAENLLNNFGAVIEEYGFIPNGFREYYLTRSQPPYFFMMVQKVVKALQQKGLQDRAEVLEKRMYEYLKKQHEYWDSTHYLTVFISGNAYKVNQYRASTKSPRPQSYKEDIQTVAGIVDPTQKVRVWQGLSSMAESGWDFSSRWLKKDQLQTTDIQQNIPSDLNALLGMMQQYLADLSDRFGDEESANRYKDRYQQRLHYFKTVKLNDRFPDFEMARTPFMPDLVYPSDFLPYLFLGEKHSVTTIYKDLVNPQSSFLRTGQQWDAPNVWAPNNWIIHEVSPDNEAKRYATEWVWTTYCSYIKHNSLFEKYKSSQLGQRGEGGEYQVQRGFGWTNGLALYYLSLYPDIKKPDCS